MSQVKSQSMSLFTRGDLFYLSLGSSTPVWPQLPKDFLVGEPLILTLEMPKEFKIVAVDEAPADSHKHLHPHPLIVPSRIDSVVRGEKVIYSLEMPADKFNDEDIVNPVRASLLINPGKTTPGKYPVIMGLRPKSGQRKWANLEATAHVLPPLEGRRPKRLIVELYNYEGYTNPEFKQGIAEAILASGINHIANMEYYPSHDTIAQRLRRQGIKANWVVFWYRLGRDLAEILPDIRQLDAEGNPMDIPLVWPSTTSVNHTWIIQNREKVIEALINYFQEKNVFELYDGITNDSEEKAFSRDRTQIKGDLYTPATLELFREHHGIASGVELTPEVIGSKYAEEWIDFRCWQTAQLSGILSEAVKRVDPAMMVGYYSGHRYVGALAGFTRWFFATDWPMVAKMGGIDFASSGYYGTIKDYAATTEALGDVPHVPAEMFIESFLDFQRSMPEPDVFAYRLMNSLMYGSGGFGVWFGQVLDAAAYYAIARVSALAAEIEDLLLDGIRCDEELVIPPMVDREAIFAYRLGARRAVVVLNHTPKRKRFELSWRKLVPKPHTIEIVAGRNLADSPKMDVDLPPRGFAVFITLSDGN